MWRHFQRAAFRLQADAKDYAYLNGEVEHVLNSKFRRAFAADGWQMAIGLEHFKQVAPFLKNARPKLGGPSNRLKRKAISNAELIAPVNMLGNLCVSTASDGALSVLKLILDVHDQRYYVEW